MGGLVEIQFLPQMKKNAILKLLSFLLVALALFLFGFYVGSNNVNLENGVTSVSELKSENKVSILLDFGNGKVILLDEVEIIEGETLANALEGALAREGLEFQAKDYGGDLGMFIEAIDGVGLGEEESGKWWQYWVNNQYGRLGVSSYVVTSGDIIYFKFSNDQQ